MYILNPKAACGLFEKQTSKMNRERLLRFFLTAVLIAFANLLQAQPFPPPPDPGPPVPIGGLGILLGAGALLGVKRMLKNRKENA